MEMVLLLAIQFFIWGKSGFQFTVNIDYSFGNIN